MHRQTRQLVAKRLLNSRDRRLNLGRVTWLFDGGFAALRSWAVWVQCFEFGGHDLRYQIFGLWDSVSRYLSSCFAALSPKPFGGLLGFWSLGVGG